MGRLTLKEIAQRLGSSLNITGIAEGFAIDSRNVRLGDIFFALKGAKQDGHAYLSEVAAKGASLAVVSKDYKGEAFGIPLIYVDNVVESLQALARQAFAIRDKIAVVGITGSMGKTTTKEFIATLLEGAFPVVKTPGNANSQVGVPLTILNSAAADKAVYVFEMSMSEPGNIAKLISIAPPDIAVVTRISLAHVAYFTDGLEGIAKAKSEILAHSQTRLAILGAQTQQFSSLSRERGFPKIIYGMGEEAAHLGVNISWERKEDGWIYRDGEEVSPILRLPFAETHLCENALAAIAVARSFQIPWEGIAEQLKLLKPYKRRFEKIEKQGILYINDSYNANIDSMKAALNNLPRPRSGGKRIAVLGSMRELGDFSERCHKELAEYALSKIDCLLCYGTEASVMVDFFRSHGVPAEFFADFEPLKVRVHSLAEPGDIVLVKGANSHQLWRIAEEP